MDPAPLLETATLSLAGAAAAPISGAALLASASLEMTGKDVDALTAARTIAPGTRIHVTFLAGEDSATRVAAARAVTAAGFVAVPHLAARRFTSVDALDDYLVALRAAGAGDEVFVVAGDPDTALGPFADALSVLRSGRLAAHGVRRVGISGYPEGHPAIVEDVLWRSLRDKARALEEQGVPGFVVTQFGFDPAVTLDWIAELRDRGVALPVRVGVPGPAGVRRLLRYAARFGVGTSAGIARKYGLSLTNLMGTAGPDRFLDALVEGYEPGRHGEIGLHFYTFGGIAATSDWISTARAAAGPLGEDR